MDIGTLEECLGEEEHPCDVYGCWRIAEKTYGNHRYCGVHYVEYQDKGYIK